MSRPSNDVIYKSQRKIYDRITVLCRKDTGATIRAAAEASGESLQGWIIRACLDRIERDQATGTAPAAPARTEVDRSATETVSTVGTISTGGSGTD